MAWLLSSHGRRKRAYRRQLSAIMGQDEPLIGFVAVVRKNAILGAYSVLKEDYMSLIANAVGLLPDHLSSYAISAGRARISFKICDDFIYLLGCSETLEKARALDILHQVREAHAASERSTSLLPLQKKPILQRLSFRLRNLTSSVKGPVSPPPQCLTVYPDAPHAYLTREPEMAPEDEVDAKLSSGEVSKQREMELRQKLLAELNDVDEFVAADEDFGPHGNDVFEEEDEEEQEQLQQEQEQQQQKQKQQQLSSGWRSKHYGVQHTGKEASPRIHPISGRQRPRKPKIRLRLDRVHSAAVDDKEAGLLNGHGGVDADKPLNSLTSPDTQGSDSFSVLPSSPSQASPASSSSTPHSTSSANTTPVLPSAGRTMSEPRPTHKRAESVDTAVQLVDSSTTERRKAIANVTWSLQHPAPGLCAGIAHSKSPMVEWEVDAAGVNISRDAEKGTVVI